MILRIMKCVQNFNDMIMAMHDTTSKGDEGVHKRD